jgi:NAD/NADP transhydrogenase alpha subunit
MIEFAIGGIYTLIIISISAFIGYLVGTKDLKKLVDEQVKRYTKSEVSLQGGPVKSKTPQQLKNDDNDEGKRIRELLRNES